MIPNWGQEFKKKERERERKEKREREEGRKKGGQFPHHCWQIFTFHQDILNFQLLVTPNLPRLNSYIKHIYRNNAINALDTHQLGPLPGQQYPPPWL